MTRIRDLLLFGLLAASCGGNKGTLSLQILTPPGDDPFASAAQSRLTLHGPAGDMVQTGQVMGGKFDLSLKEDSPTMDYVQLTVEALDANMQVLGRGRSPNIVLSTMDGSLTIFVGRPGKVSPTAQQLQDDSMMPSGRKDLCGAALRGTPTPPAPQPGLGALVVGGVGAAGNSLASAWLYNPLSHAMIAAGSALKARRGAVMVPSADTNQAQQALLWGGVVTTSSKDGDPLTTAELFDPAQSVSTLFSPPSMEVADAGGPGAIAPAVAEVQSGVFLVSGGHDKNGPLNQAVLLERFPPPQGSTGNLAHPGVRRIPAVAPATGPMVTARAGHSATPVTVAGGAAVLLFGGQKQMDDNTSPVAELFALAKLQFQGLTLMTADSKKLPSRQEHVAVPLSSGKVLVAGGVLSDDVNPNNVLASALIIDPQNPVAEDREGYLATARKDASAFVSGSEVLICGGLGADGMPVGNCEVFAADTAQKARDPVPLPTPRAGHVALPLDTGQVIFVGGAGPMNSLPASIDIYTPLK